MINRDQPQADQVLGISREGFIIAIIIIAIDERIGYLSRKVKL